MQEVLKKLEQVQELDLQINSLTQRKAGFPERLAAYEAEIKSNTAKFDEKKKLVDEFERNKRQQLGALELNEERAKRSQEKLEQIKTNQEYQALAKEIDTLKKNSTVIQENASKVDEELQKSKKDLEIHESALKECLGKRDLEAAKIAEETKAFDAELSRLNKLRLEAIVGIDKRYLAAYDRVRMTKTGIGIVPAVGGNCRGCNMRIPPQVYNELRKGEDLHFCPSCRRILFYKENTASANH